MEGLLIVSFSINYTVARDSDLRLRFWTTDKTEQPLSFKKLVRVRGGISYRVPIR